MTSTTTAGKEYNGHPSYEHWNASLWFNNDEIYYRMAQEAKTADRLIAMCKDAGVTRTPDGVRLTQKLIRYAWETVNED